MGLIPARFARRVDADSIGLYTEDLTRLLKLTHSSGRTTLYGGTATGDDLIIRANSTDGYPNIEMLGNQPVIIHGNTDGVSLASGGAIALRAYRLGTDGILASNASGDNVYLYPAGTGKVKFGTHTALSGESLSGYITIKDSGGTLRKLAVIS